MYNFKIVINVLGVLLVMLGAFMLLPLIVSFVYDTGDKMAFILAALTSISTGSFFWITTKHASKSIAKREGFLIVALGWFVISLFSSLPYFYSGFFDGFHNSIFESVSGLTTTGATVLNDIESMPHGILFWRSLTQWIGGMGIIVLTVAIFPLLGIGGVELFVAESPGPTSSKIHPRIKETAKRLWAIYLSLTVLLIMILCCTKMSFFDALNHGLTTMATGGFSTKNASVAHFNSPLIEYILCFFMFIAGVNYTIIYFSLKGQIKKVWRSDEFKTYLFLVLFLMTIVTLAIFSCTSLSFEKSFRNATFQLISVITTTGFITADYTSWTPALTLLFFILLFVGACAGSTSGGIKIIRHLVIFKNTFLELKRLLHPKAIIRMKVDKTLVQPKILTHILVFLLLYMMVFVSGSVIMSFILRDFDQPLLSALGAVATSLGNVGPSIGQLGPADNFAAIPSVGKWFLIFLMLMGRLELFTMLILFTPYFWKRN